jgi:dTDP-4-dehydrorhamnose reductase
MAASGNILITGHRGQLGADLVAGLSPLHKVTGVDLPEVDICDLKQVLKAVRFARPDVVIHAAAYTDVDGCEADHEKAFEVNRDGTWNVAQACAEMGARMIYYSTDYVYDGTSATAYVETDIPNPKTVYGLSKLEGEEAVQDMAPDHAILRIAWVYGRHGKNFVKTMIRIGKQQAAAAPDTRVPLKVVDDQIGNPTWTDDIVRQTEVILDSDLRGIFHSTAEGETSWYAFARNIFENMKMAVDLRPCTTADYPRPAPRPARSSLENRRLKEAGCNVMRDQRVALAEFLNRYGRELFDEV